MIVLRVMLKEPTRTFFSPFNLSAVFVSLSTDLVKLHVSSKITAECGKQVTLICKVSSSLEGLSIKHMGWSQNKSLCSVNSEGKITTNHRHTLSDFHCEYKDGQLSLNFQEVQPSDIEHSNSYMCKLHSNKGAPHGSTKVELQGQNPHLFLYVIHIKIRTNISLNCYSSKTAVMNLQKTGRLLFSNFSSIAVVE